MDIYFPGTALSKPKSKLAHAETTDIYAFGQLCFFFITRRDPVPKLSDNAFALREELRGWLFEEPARKLGELYEACTHEDPLERIQNFREVCDKLFEISVLIKEVDHKKEIEFNVFARQLSFSIVGLSPERIKSDTSFLTTPGRTLVEIINELPSQVVFRLESQVPLTVDGANNYKEARDIINQRIDNVLLGFPRAHKRQGAQGPFETFVYLRKVPMSIDGVEICRSMLTRIIDSIERS